MNPIIQSNSKVGVYIDVANMYSNGGHRMRYDVLREFAGRDNADIVRLNAYASYDADRAKSDVAYGASVNNFHSILRDFGYKVITKTVKWYEDESGKRYGKANADLELAVDALLQSQNLDRVVIATGDGDFIQVVRALQNQGCRVEIIGLDNTSAELRHEADMFLSGYLIPNLIPINGGSTTAESWGELGSRVRGVCYYHSEQGYGFIRYLARLEAGLWLIDTRHPSSPYETVFFHDSNLPADFNPNHLPSRRYIFEFTLAESNREGYQADEIRLISRMPA